MAGARLAASAFPAKAAEKDTWSLASPDGRCAISVTLAHGQLSYQALREGRGVIQPSPLGLRCNDGEFSQGLSFVRADRARRQREAYELWAGVQPSVDHWLQMRRLVFRNAQGAVLGLDLAASDEGVAFRYVFTETNAAVRVAQAELTGFNVPSDAHGWLQPYHAAGPYTPAYEDFYFHVAPGQPPPNSRQRAVGWAFPALFQAPTAGAWVLLTESGTDAGYCGCHLGPDSDGARYQIAFPLADEATRGYTNRFGPEPRHSLPWTLPWRVLVLGANPGAIATATLVTDLAAPSRFADTAWIRPGRASWGWWSYPDGPADAALFDQFSDFAARMVWEYTLFDAGWWKPGLGPIARHALDQGLLPCAWSHAGDYYDPVKRDRQLDQMSAAGVHGVKVEFWCSDRQEAIAAQEGLMQAAAARKMVVNLHGCTIPRGWQRTWPNFLTCEAVLGSESYFYESRYAEKAAELDTVLPFTRNAVGPMDLTPIACSPKKYERTTTAAHQLAAALIFTSGIVHYADRPEFFESLPPAAQRILRDAPARWDETRCLLGEPGTVAVFARRAGSSWYLAGINGTGKLLPVVLDLAPYRNYRQRLVLIEGMEPRMEVRTFALPVTRDWRHILPPRGGFILRLDRAAG